MSKEPTTSRPCDFPGCPESGDYRAPKDRSHLREYYWFCLVHVREYNKSWDYYKDMTGEEIERSRIDDITWNRPTRKVSAARWAHYQKTIEEQILGFDGGDAYFAQRSALPEDYKVALGVMELSFPCTLEELKAQYKKLVKKHHPDLNRGDKVAEEKFKKINHAHSVLRKYLKP